MVLIPPKLHFLVNLLFPQKTIPPRSGDMVPQKVGLRCPAWRATAVYKRKLIESLSVQQVFKCGWVHLSDFSVSVGAYKII